MKTDKRTIGQKNCRQGFTLIEMLVVIGILAILVGIGMATFSSATGKAQKAKGTELVNNVATALESIYQKEGNWPRRILSQGSSEGEIDSKIAYEIGSRGAMSITYDKTTKEATGMDRCGIVSPWAQAVIKRAGNKSVTDGTKIPSGGTLKDHRLRFAVDTEGKGYVNANVGGESIRIRGSVAVWCSGKDGKIEKYSDGLKRDDIYSWSRQQIKK